MKVGSNGYEYELVEDFAKLPEGETFGLISRLTTDSQDRLYVFQRRHRRIEPGELPVRATLALSAAFLLATLFAEHPATSARDLFRRSRSGIG